ncbi:hypothetical protein FKM82_008520 [Ascaphus truei]
MDTQHCVTLRDVQEALDNIQGLVHMTPVMSCSSLDTLAARKLSFKCELLQKTGSFKIRGALNAVKKLSAENPVAVVTHSSGNHGQALALTAQMSGIPAYVVVPRTAASCKKAAIRAYGALIVECDPTDEVATLLVWGRMKLLIEPTAGLGLAVVLSKRFQEVTSNV